MGRSPPLRVYCQQLNAHFGLAFASPPSQKDLSLPLTITRRLIKQKARRRPCGLRHLVDVSFQVLFHSAHSGTFHLSLAVLVHYRSPISIWPYAAPSAHSYEGTPASYYSS